MNKKEIVKFEMESDEFSVNCTGDVCRGDEITFQRDKFTGSYFKPKYDGQETIYARVVKDSYGKDKQQHTFTLECLETGRIFRIKGRNVYAYGTYRRRWKNEEERNMILTEKHARGDEARRLRTLRTETPLNYVEMY